MPTGTLNVILNYSLLFEDSCSYTSVSRSRGLVWSEIPRKYGERRATGASAGRSTAYAILAALRSTAPRGDARTWIKTRRRKDMMQSSTSAAYDEAYFQRQIAKSDAKIRWQYDQMLRYAGVTLDDRTTVLDLGCGAAPGLRYLQARGVRTIGADVSAAGLLAARRLLPRARLVRCDVERPLPFASGAFDLLILSELVEHVRGLPAILAECRRVLRPGGAVVLTTPNLWDVRRAIGALGGPTWSGYRDDTHVNLQNPRSIRQRLTEVGFRGVRVRAGWKPVARLGGRRLPVRVVIPYPPLIGNGLLATGRA